MIIDSHTHIRAMSGLLAGTSDEMLAYADRPRIRDRKERPG